MSRTELATLRERLRGYTEAGSADYTVGTTSFWGDALLDEVLDRHRADVWFELLVPQISYIGGGSVAYYDYYSGHANYEETSGGTSIFQVQDAVGDTQGTSTWTADYQRGRVTFTSDTDGSAMYVTGRSYNLEGAAADIWRQKAAHYANAYDVSTDNHTLNRSQLVKHCREMADYYQALSGSGGQGITTVQTCRSDEVA